ncbi:FtsW/RodA/SpoVE family cell cycle protein [Metabacillus fastidiosus]|uniref:FtsW/RodA/SpoVE family cell cycle protein n=1 Tax=Metabacillus fastidiosus TaxID=1458 RepID=A0ABU6NYQ0_9BACI|nr:FtsW/RodA/SpoVE family cell cycle protein [Metabacillus fastidiosus]MED4402248.1 FtsW/RodA/SpoVE family cell cycle protein [Metabacillus fastidiosus]MED4462119.1 FtsW/RodA/SpoVE family cell cycle protein [Metabacillus fastidiosus]
MSSPKFEEFLSKVTSKVKYKEARNMIKKELTNHLQELSQSYKNRGFSKEDADEKTIQEMGNPFTIGENLNALHKPKMDWVLIVIFIIIAGISFLPLVGGVPEISLSSTYFVGQQAIWYTIAVPVILGFLFFDYQKLKNWWMYFYAGGLLVHLYLHLFGNTTSGAKKWISLSGLTVDGTMISLFLFFIAWAGIFNKINEFQSWKKQGLLFVLFWTPILFYMMVPNLMNSIIYFFCLLGMFACARVHQKLDINLIVTNIVAGILFIIIFIMTSHQSYLFTRLFTVINPDADPNGAGYLYIAVRNVLTEAGWFGNGLYNDLNFQLLPETHTDFAFPFLVYSLGWAFGIVLCFILLIFVSRISKNAFKTKDLYGRLIVIGGAALFAVPTTWNILMGLGIVPIMEVSLPFISYGGSGILFYAAVLGLILNVYRRKDMVEPTIVDFK